MGIERNFKYGLQTNGSKSQPVDEKSSLKGVWPIEISVSAKARDSNYVY